MAAAVTATEAGWPRRTAGLAPCTLGIEVRDDQPWGEERGTAGKVEKDRRGWVIYFPPARHNLSRGFSREHAESAAIEEEAGRCVRKEENRKRVGPVGRGWIKGAAVAAADASRWRYQGTDVMEARYPTCRVLHFALDDERIGSKRERNGNIREAVIDERA